MTTERNLPEIELLYTKFKGVVSQCKVVPKDQNIRPYLIWTVENGYPTHEIYITHAVPNARELHW